MSRNSIFAPSAFPSCQVPYSTSRTRSTVHPSPPATTLTSIVLAPVPVPTCSRSPSSSVEPEDDLQDTEDKLSEIEARLTRAARDLTLSCDTCQNDDTVNGTCDCAQTCADSDDGGTTSTSPDDSPLDTPLHSPQMLGQQSLPLKPAMRRSITCPPQSADASSNGRHYRISAYSRNVSFNERPYFGRTHSKECYSRRGFEPVSRLTVREVLEMQELDCSLGIWTSLSRRASSVNPSWSHAQSDHRHSEQDEDDDFVPQLPVSPTRLTSARSMSPTYSLTASIVSRHKLHLSPSTNHQLDPLMARGRSREVKAPAPIGTA